MGRILWSSVYDSRLYEVYVRKVLIIILIVKIGVKIYWLILWFSLLKTFMLKFRWNTFVQILWFKSVFLSRHQLMEMMFAFVAIVINFDSSLLVLEVISFCLDMFNKYSWISYHTILWHRKFCSTSSDFLLGIYVKISTRGRISW